MNDVGESAGDLVGVAERLRAVKNAQRRFLRLWGIEQALVEPMLDRVAADVEQAEFGATGDMPPPFENYDSYDPPAAGPSSAFGR